jgi:hypothetical protein|tara:strand:+ start:1121 stop:1342 length:222 start_codon:yes stop_codon:yes gene_type:complete
METQDNIDIREFKKWITKNIYLILNTRQTRLFKKMEMSFEDIKLFGKESNVRGYYKLHQNRFQQNQFNWITNY